MIRGHTNDRIWIGFPYGAKNPDQSGAAGVLNAELTTPVSSDGTVWHGRERMRLIGKGFFSSTDESVPVCATVPLGLAGTAVSGSRACSDEGSSSRIAARRVAQVKNYRFSELHTLT
jgi:hypothetical protein